MFESERGWLPEVAEGEIEGVIDSWGRVSEMPPKLMRMVVYLAGVTGGVFWRYAPLEAGVSLQSPDDRLAPARELREEWQAEVNELMKGDAHEALTASLLRWLTVGCDISRKELKHLDVPSNALLVKRMPTIWRRLDELPAVVAFHYACALSRWTDRDAVRETVRRLAAERPLPSEGIEGLWGCYLYFSWVRELAAVQPVAALKVALEAVLRWRARMATAEPAKVLAAR
jgi:hypothetical protein